MLFRISYINKNDNIDHKAFKDTKEAMNWVKLMLLLIMVTI